MIKLFVKNNAKIAIIIIVPEKLDENNEIIKKIRENFSLALEALFTSGCHSLANLK